MKLELSIHASKLKNVAGLGKGTSDPFAVITEVATASNGAKPKVIGKTEVIKNSLSPHWVKTFPVEYELGTPKKIAISIFDEVRKGNNKPMGSCVFDIGEILGARGNVKAKQCKGGTVFAHVRKSQGTGMLRLKMYGVKLKNVEGFMKKSDPFYELSRRADSAGGLTWDNIYRSKPQKNNLNPDWEEAVVELSTLCDGDQDKPILVSVYDYESNGKHVPMGQFETTVNGLTSAASGNTMITLKKKGKETGKIGVKNAQVTGVEDVTAQMANAKVSSPQPAVAAVPVPAPVVAAPAVPPAFNPSAFVPAPPPPQRPTFIDYVSGGCELNVAVAIDYTGSNGDPRRPGTLHYIHRDGQLNDYEKAIHSIVHILSKYDSDCNFPVWGFGAKYGGVVRHLFQCGPTPEVHGVQGVIDAYRQTFQTGLIMSGPTVFTEVIQTAAAKAASSQEQARQQGKQAYTILLILTDGAVSDVNATAACLNQVSDAPLSVVIVGVGNADFSSMRFLDDNSHAGGIRDIAQFVQFNQHSTNSAALSSETLQEIPDQLVGFFQSKGIPPLPPVSRHDNEIMVEPEEEEIDLNIDFGSGGADEEIVVSGGQYQRSMKW
mmetsp:Transcript_1708/g.1969  ORF Transcript_1708/g.1969 Transcript_1708/m.1969 type:complete len:603 (+) Transcript_1708:113-1921(+)|eukprot:CAMPEP_0195306114 /NCGR_PEP_ID=MMETSP0707-20130614/37034_1 /TAXON_ID=33640 /ORGANISM="Asterionellopsis glacialis, Strain CCMP134" /LENGTH=602 /DNA_ID=CAMNT_0040370323 /DNA_START=184 /DNA_END=1992 /DNA_ORIENTATION=+